MQLSAVEVDTSIDTVKTDLSTLEVGDRVYFDINITHSPDTDVRYIQQKPTDVFMITGVRDNTFQKNNELLTSYEFVSALFDTGEQTIPAQQFIVYSQDDSTTVYSDSMVVQVRSVLPADSTELKDIKPPVGLTLGFWDIAIPLFLILIVVAVIIFITRRKKGLPLLPEKKKVILPAHVIALKKIDQLKLSDLLSKGEIKQYFVEVSWIAREYLENRFHRPFLEMTGFEIRQALKTLHVQERTEINEIIRECDRVKFAKHIPPLEEADNIIERLIEFIYKTKEEETQENNAN